MKTISIVEIENDSEKSIELKKRFGRYYTDVMDVAYSVIADCCPEFCGCNLKVYRTSNDGIFFHPECYEPIQLASDKNNAVENVSHIGFGLIICLLTYNRLLSLSGEQVFQAAVDSLTAFAQEHDEWSKVLRLSA